MTQGRTMPARTNDQNPFGDGDLNQDLIDQMLSGGAVDQTAGAWDGQTLQAEIDAARSAAGVMVDDSPPRLSAPSASAPSRAPAASRTTRPSARASASRRRRRPSLRKSPQPTITPCASQRRWRRSHRPRRDPLNLSERPYPSRLPKVRGPGS